MKTATVRPSVGGVNVRQNPKTKSKLLDAIEPGHAVEITNESGNWVHIKYLQAGKACSGWAIRSSFVNDKAEDIPISTINVKPGYWAVFIAAAAALMATVGAFLTAFFK